MYKGSIGLRVWGVGLMIVLTVGSPRSEGTFKKGYVGVTEGLGFWD